MPEDNEKVYLMDVLEYAELKKETLKEELDATTITMTPPTKIISAATTTTGDAVLIAQLKEQGSA